MESYITYLVAGEKTSVCGGARDRSMVLPARGPLGFTFRSDDNHVRTFYFVFSIWSSNMHDLVTVCVFSAD